MEDQAERLRQITRQWEGKEEVPASAPHKRCRIAAVSSGKGGVGKTNLVVNLALTLARWSYRVVILDADLGLANVDILMNVTPRYSLEEVVNGSKDLKEIMVECSHRVKLIPGGSGLFGLANLDRERRGRLLEHFKHFEEEDLLLVDTAAGLSRNVLGFLGAADEAIIVTSPEPAALTDAYGIIKVINQKEIQKKVQVVVNFVGNAYEGEEVFQRLQKVVRKYLPRVQISYLGGISRDPLVAVAIQSCRPLVISYPQSPAASSIQRIARRFLYREDGAAGEDSRTGMKGFIKRLQSLT